MSINIDLGGVSDLAARVSEGTSSVFDSLAIKPNFIAGACQQPGTDFTSPEIVSRVQGLSDEMKVKMSDISQRLYEVSRSLNTVHDSFAENDVEAATAAS